MKLAEQIRNLDQQQRAQATDGYAELVHAAWSGVEVDPAQALETLNGAGKTAADLEADCRLLDELDANRKLARTLPKLRTDYQALADEEQAAREEFKQAHLAYIEKMKQLEQSKDALSREMNLAETAARALQNDPRFRDEAIYNQRCQLDRKVVMLRQAWMSAENQVREDLQTRAEEREHRRLDEKLWELRRRNDTEPEQKELRAQIDALPAKYADRIARRDRLREQVAAVEARQRELEAQAIA